MKSYTSACGRLTFPWKLVLSNKIMFFLLGWMTYRLSSSWITCAVGAQSCDLKRDEMGRPYDYELRVLGVEFHHSIHCGNRQQAYDLYLKIEERANNVIHEMYEAMDPNYEIA